MKLYSLFISNDTQNDSELFLTEEAAVTRWIEAVYADHAEDAAECVALHAQYDRIGLREESEDGGASVADRLAEKIASWDTFALTEHDLDLARVPGLGQLLALAGATDDERQDGLDRRTYREGLATQALALLGQPARIKVLIEVEGGAVQDATCSHPDAVDILICDHDNDHERLSDEAWEAEKVTFADGQTAAAFLRSLPSYQHGF